jgi:hypothetical protein
LLEVERRLRALLNPFSCWATDWWIGGQRRTPDEPLVSGQRGTHALHPSPAGWDVPVGMRPGWDWLPAPGGVPRLRSMPRWARVWYRTPFLDRYAHEWMWWHGAWAVRAQDNDPPPSGVREPRRPFPVHRSDSTLLPEEQAS